MIGAQTMYLSVKVSPAPQIHNPQSAVFQRQCACGQHTPGGGECEECKKKRQDMLQRASIQSSSFSPYDFASGVTQTKLAINKAGDEYEQEADRIADQVMTASLRHAVRNTSPQIRRYAVQPAGQVETAPASVDQVLASPGSPLEPGLRHDMEKRFGYDFSQVRVHSDSAAERSAQAVNALAYTARQDIVFGQGQYKPGSFQGAKLLAHELTHVIQQSRAGLSGAVNIVTNEQRQGSQPRSITGMIARQPNPPAPEKTVTDDKSKNKPVLLVDKDGKIIEGVFDEKGNLIPGKSVSDEILRIHIEGLKGGYGEEDQEDEFWGQGQITTESAKENAVALLPGNVYKLALNQKGQSEKGSEPEKVKIDVLLHFHGYGIGYRRLVHEKVMKGKKKVDKTDYAGILKPDELRDVNLYQMEQQIHGIAQNRLIIAVLPQGSQRSKFGDEPSKKSDDYLKKVFDKLKEQNFLPKNATPGRLIVSAHSGGGGLAMEAANQPARAGTRTDVILFDAINSSCDKEEVEGKDGKKEKRCKTPLKCNTQYDQVEEWVTKKMNEDILSLRTVSKDQQAKTLETSGTRFRGYTSEDLISEYSCSYGYWYYKLNQHIKNKIDIENKKLPADVQKQLHENYRVQSVGGSHENILGPKNLEDALKD